MRCSRSPVWSAFALLHPQVQIDVRTSDRVVDPVKEGIDVAMRMGWLRDSTLRAVKLGDFEQQVVASPGYLQRAGRRPRQPQDLADHEWVALDLLRSPLTWKFSAADGTIQTVRMKGRLRADSAATLRSLLEIDAGVSVLDQYSAAQAVSAGRLVRLLPRWSLPTGGLYAVFPPGRHMPAIVRAFVEFYRSTLQKPPLPFWYVPISSACASTCPCMTFSRSAFFGVRRSGSSVSSAYSLKK